MTWFLLWLVAFVGAWLLTGALRRYALARSLMDIPNERSSHKVPTPRGGGMAIVVSYLACLGVLWALGWLAASSWAAYVGAGIWVALVGFLDDHGHIPARWRLLAHFLGAGWVLFCLAGLPALTIFGHTIDPGWWGQAVAAIYLVWLLNLYNFMDGIDGIASIEALTVCLGAALVTWLVLPGETAWRLPLVLAAAAGGFLVWNYPPAKIFMGDAGSGFLGLMLGTLSIEAAKGASQLFWCWAILLAVFVVDASVTLLRRVLRGERFYQAHRSHAYQHSARQLGAHKPVSLAIGAINLLWLLPIAIVVALGHLDGAAGVLVAYIPLIWLAVHCKAGEPAGRLD